MPQKEHCPVQSWRNGMTEIRLRRSHQSPDRAVSRRLMRSVRLRRFFPRQRSHVLYRTECQGRAQPGQSTRWTEISVVAEGKEVACKERDGWSWQGADARERELRSLQRAVLPRQLSHVLYRADSQGRAHPEQSTRSPPGREEAICRKTGDGRRECIMQNDSQGDP